MSDPMSARCKTCGCGPYDTLSMIEGGNCMECDEAMLKRVRTAICKFINPYEAHSDEVDEIAKAAIEAMKEPAP